MKKTIIAFILGGIIFSTITATAAYVYTARDINYQSSDENWNVNNVQEAISELKTDVNNINNKVEGIERIYKAGEVELVALVSDDSFYTDSNGKYVLSNSNTGRTLLADTSTYKSLPSTQDCVGIVGQDKCFLFETGSFKITSLKMDGVYYSSNAYNQTNLIYSIYDGKDTLPITNTITLGGGNLGNVNISDIVYVYNTKDVSAGITPYVRANSSGRYKIWDSITGQGTEGNYNKDDNLFKFNGSYQTITVIKLN